MLRSSPARAVSGSDGNTRIALEQLDQGLRVLARTVFVDHRLKQLPDDIGQHHRGGAVIAELGRQPHVLVHQGEGEADAEVAFEQFPQGQFGRGAARASRCNTAVRGSKVTFGLGVER